MDINIDKLIKVIKKQRVLYDNSSKEYYDRIKRRQLWDDVCIDLHPSWDTADENEKTLYGKEVQKKWQSLRDCFRRELAAQKNSTTFGTKKKAKYKYFDQLEFLIPFTQSMNVDASDQESGNFLLNDLESPSNSKDPLSHYENSRKRKRSISDEEIIIPREQTVRRESGNRYLDDDEAFLMSLLPSFKEYTWEDKYLLRIELMKTILKFKQTQREQETFSISVKSEYVEVDEGSTNVNDDLVSSS